MSADSRFRATLRLRAVSKSFVAGAANCTASVAALDEASVEIRGGEVLLICGPAGAGKTTLLLCTAGLLHFDSGDIVRGTRRVAYRDLAHPAVGVHNWPLGGVILLDSCDAIGELMRARVSRAIAAALTSASGLVLATRDPQNGFALVPSDATLSIVHLRRGRIAGNREDSGSIHRVAEAAGGGY